MWLGVGILEDLVFMVIGLVFFVYLGLRVRICLCFLVFLVILLMCGGEVLKLVVVGGKMMEFFCEYLILRFRRFVDVIILLGFGFLWVVIMNELWDELVCVGLSLLYILKESFFGDVEVIFENNCKGFILVDVFWFFLKCDYSFLKLF